MLTLPEKGRLCQGARNCPELVEFWSYDHLESCINKVIRMVGIISVVGLAKEGILNLHFNFMIAEPEISFTVWLALPISTCRESGMTLSRSGTSS